MPAAQLEHADDDAREYEPAAHVKHPAPVVGWYLPVAQLPQLDEPATEIVPIGQLTHPVLPPLAAKNPAAQLTQAEAPGAAP